VPSLGSYVEGRKAAPARGVVDMLRRFWLAQEDDRLLIDAVILTRKESPSFEGPLLLGRLQEGAE